MEWRDHWEWPRQRCRLSSNRVVGSHSVYHWFCKIIGGVWRCRIYSRPDSSPLKQASAKFFLFDDNVKICPFCRGANFAVMGSKCKTREKNLHSHSHSHSLCLSLSLTDWLSDWLTHSHTHTLSLSLSHCLVSISHSLTPPLQPN